jgi:hypothetical protein
MDPSFLSAIVPLITRSDTPNEEDASNAILYQRYAFNATMPREKRARAPHVVIYVSHNRAH